MYNVSIPKISEAELLARYKRIKPIVQIDGKKYFLREFTEKELSLVPYIRHAKEDKREEVNLDEYRPMHNGDFECLHKYRHYALFKPSVAEVLAQISERDLDSACAFEIVESPRTADDFAKHKVAFANGYHVSLVRLYYRNR